MSEEKLNQIKKLMEDYPTTTKAYIEAKEKHNDPSVEIIRAHFVIMVSKFREKLWVILR